MAASRWRTWDKDYFIDTIDSRPPEEGEIISAVGYGRGKPKKDISTISLPRAALIKTQDVVGFTRSSATSNMGRGQALKERALLGTAPARRPGLKPPINILKNPDCFVPLQESPKLRKSQQDLDWPVLGSSSVKSSSPEVKKNQQSKPLTFAAVSKPRTPSLPSKVPSVASESDGNDIVILDNLPPSMTEKELCELFKEYGDILACNIECNSDGNSLGSAVVRMEDKQICEWIVSCFDGTDYAGYCINCKLLEDP